MKRFYKQATYQTDADHTGDTGRYVLYLDGKTIKTPMGHAFYAPREAIAQIICDEWNAQGEMVIPDTMPVYSIIATAIDKGTGADRAAITDNIRDYIDGDLLSYQTNAPDDLSARQKQSWGRAIDLFTQIFHTSPAVTYDIQAVTQPADHAKAVTDYIDGLDPWRFTLFHILVSHTGSPMIACLAMHQKLTTDEIMEIILTEDRFYQEKYMALGQEKPADETEKEKRLQLDIESCLRVIACL